MAKNTTPEATPKTPKKSKEKAFEPIPIEKQSAYCAKCRETTKVKKDTGFIIKSSNGRFRLTGICRTCGTKVSKFVADPTKSAA